VQWNLPEFLPVGPRSRPDSGRCAGPWTTGCRGR
jgi:hypothetical protein